MSAIQESIQEVYIGLLGRAADLEGLTYWEGQINSGFTIEDLRENIINSQTEYAEGLGLLSRGELVEALYDNMFGRTPDLEGYAYWTAGDGAAVSDEDMVTTLVRAAQGSDVTILDNKATAANYFTNNAPDSTDTAAAATAIANVDETAASVTASQGVVDGIGGQTIAMVTGTETVTGGDSADSISAVVSALTSAKTLDVTDTIDGGAGSDTFTAVMSSAFAGFSTGSMTNVETVDLSNTSSIARDFDTTGITGVDTYNLDMSGKAINLKDLASSDTTINMSDLASGAVSVSYATAATTTNAQALTLTDMGDSDNTVTLTLPTVEAATATVSGANYVNFTAAAVETLTLVGDGTLTTASGPAAMTVLDAGEATGAIDFNASASSNGTSATLGSGDDVLRIVQGNDFLANASLTGGDGDDVLHLDGAAAATTQFTQSGFEEIQIDGLATGDLIMSLVNTSGVETVTVENDSVQNITLASFGAGDATVNLKGANAADTGADGLSIDTTGALTINTVAGSSATAAAPSVNAYDVTATGATSLDINVAAKTSYDGQITSSTATSWDLAVTGDVGTGSVLSTAAATAGVISSVSVDSDLTLTAANLETLDITTTKAIALDASTLTSLQTLAVNTTDDVDLTGVALPAITTVSASGVGSLELGALGSATLTDYGVTVTATGLSTNESAGSESLEIASINTQGTAISLDASGVLGKVDVTGAINADNSADTIGNVTLDFSNTGGNIELDAVTGNAVTFDAANALGSVTLVSFDVESTFDFTGATLVANTLSDAGDITATGATLTAALTGGIAVDNFSFDVTNAVTTTVTLTGDLNTGTDVIVLDASAQSTVDEDYDMTISIAGLENYDGATITGSANDDTITGGGDADTIDGGNGTDTIDGGAGADNIEGGLLVDTLTGGAGADSFVYDGATDISVNETEGDEITDFTVGSDHISFDIGSGVNASAFYAGFLSGNVNILDTDTLTAGGTVTTAMVSTYNSAGGSLTATLSASFDTDGTTYFSAASVSAAILAFQAYLTGVSFDSGVIFTAEEVGAFAKLYDGDDYFLAMAFIEVAASGSVAATQVDIHVINMDDADFTAADIQFLAAS